MKISTKKMEYLCTEGGTEQSVSLSLHGLEVLRSVSFTYLSSTVPEDSGTEVQVEVGRRIQAGWFRWKRVTGILYDMKVPNWVKMKEI